MAEVQNISRELLVNDARTLHAVQKNAKAMMKRVINRLDDYPEAKSRLLAQNLHLIIRLAISLGDPSLPPSASH